MFSSIGNNGYILYDPSNLGQTTTRIQNPSFDHYHHHQRSPLNPYFEACIGNGKGNGKANSSMTNQLGVGHQDHNLGSCSNTVPSPRNETNNKEEVPRKRSTKDRHKKIQTAKGLRARRMRLSTVVAHKFFHLQDLLGFDKGSMTIAWLLSVSEASITRLLRSVAAPSGGDEEQRGHVETEMDEVEAQEGTTGAKRTGTRRPLKTVKRSRTTKESRNEARRRARERTMTKRMNMRPRSVFGITPGSSSCHRQETNSDDSDQHLGSYGTSQETQEDIGPKRSQETRQEQEQEQEQGMLSDIDLLEHQMGTLRSIERFLGIDSDSSSSSVSGDSTGKNSKESHTVLAGNWSTGVSHEAQFQNPSFNESFACLNQNPSVSRIVPMATTSSTMFEEHNNTSLSASTNHPSNYISSWSVFDPLY